MIYNPPSASTLGAEVTSHKDAVNGYAGLDAGGLLKPAEFPAPSSSFFGGIKALALVAHKYLTSIGTDGIPVAAQPVQADLSDLPILVANGGTGKTQAGKYGVMIAQSWVSIKQSTQAEAVVFTATVPANLLSANGSVKVLFMGKNGTVTGNATYRIRVAVQGSGLTGTTLMAIASAVSNSNFGGDITIGARGATNSQISSSNVRNASAANNDVNTPSAIDTTTAWDIVVTLQLANADSNGAEFMGAAVIVYP